MSKNIFEFADFEITKREIIASVSIIAVLLIIGLVISGKISEHYLDKNEIYNKAVKIESSELFHYGMETNVGNAFVYGELKAVDTVTYPEIGGQYMYINKVKEKYTRHTRTKTYTDSKGKTHTKQEVYYSWDHAGSEDLSCNEISFCDTVFPSEKISFPSADYIETVKESRTVRYKYYGCRTEYTGTLFTDLRDNTISSRSHFYSGMDIQDTVESLYSSETAVQIIFWTAWIVLLVFIVSMFYRAKNNWLE